MLVFSTKIVFMAIGLIVVQTHDSQGSETTKATGTTAGNIIWHWGGSELSGTFVTNCTTCGGGPPPAGSYRIVNYASIRGSSSVHVGPTYGTSCQAPHGFLWDGTKPTQFWRSGGYYTNGFSLYTTNSSQQDWAHAPISITFHTMHSIGLSSYLGKKTLNIPSNFTYSGPSTYNGNGDDATTFCDIGHGTISPRTYSPTAPSTSPTTSSPTVPQTTSPTTCGPDTDDSCGAALGRKECCLGDFVGQLTRITCPTLCCNAPCTNAPTSQPTMSPIVTTTAPSESPSPTTSFPTVSPTSTCPNSVVAYYARGDNTTSSWRDTTNKYNAVGFFSNGATRYNTRVLLKTLKFNTTGQRTGYTFAVYASLTGSTSQTYSTLLGGRKTDSDVGGTELFFGKDESVACFGMQDSSMTSRIGCGNKTTTDAFTDGKKHSFIYTQSANRLGRVYVDGVDVTGSHGMTWSGSSADHEQILIGTEDESNGYPWTGSIDEVLLLNTSIDSTTARQLDTSFSSNVPYCGRGSFTAPPTTPPTATPTTPPTTPPTSPPTTTPTTPPTTPPTSPPTTTPATPPTTPPTSPPTTTPATPPTPPSPTTPPTPTHVPTLGDLCNVHKCSLDCFGECGWDTKQTMCVTGETTDAIEHFLRLGDCPSFSPTTSPNIPPLNTVSHQKPQFPHWVIVVIAVAVVLLAVVIVVAIKISQTKPTLALAPALNDPTYNAVYETPPHNPTSYMYTKEILYDQIESNENNEPKYMDVAPATNNDSEI